MLFRDEKVDLVNANKHACVFHERFKINIHFAKRQRLSVLRLAD